MADEFTPTSICNQALDAALIDLYLGDIEEGTRPAQICMRWYTHCVEQLLRGAHWDFARKQATLELVADASGQTAGVGTLVPGPFLYSYAYPSDCLKIRYLPANYWNVNPPIPTGNIVPPDNTAPLTTAVSQPPLGSVPIVPSRFLIGTDVNYIPEGASNEQRGISPIGRTVIMSNVQYAVGVYTFNASYPNLWDALFRDAVVAYIASQIAVPLARDKKLGLTARKDNAAIAAAKLQEARRVNGNETWANGDLNVDWMMIRNGGGACGDWGNNWGGPSPGYLFGGWDAVSFAGNTAAY